MNSNASIKMRVRIGGGTSAEVGLEVKIMSLI